MKNPLIYPKIIIYSVFMHLNGINLNNFSTNKKTQKKVTTKNYFLNLLLKIFRLELEEFWVLSILKIEENLIIFLKLNISDKYSVIT